MRARAARTRGRPAPPRSTVAGVGHGGGIPSRLDADLIVLGGGCAGLSLAQRLARGKSGLRVLVLERRTSYQDDRTWCFWQRPQRAPGLAHRRWPRWRFSCDGRRVTHHAPAYAEYRCVRSLDFYQDALAALAAQDDVRLLRGQAVGAIHAPGGAGGVAVETQHGTLRARWLVDTRPAGIVARAGLKQVFAGVEVHAERPVFDDAVVGLMEDMTVDAHGFRFTYVLPFTATHGLVETTRFTAAPPERLGAVSRVDLDEALAPVRARSALRFGRREHGALPMDADAVRPSAAPGVVTAGTAGGALRPSSGYAFLRIQAWARACAARLAEGAPPIGHPPDPRWRRSVDQLFLRVIRADPRVAPDAFMAMAAQLEARTFVRFLSDDATPGDFVRVASVLPKAPFLRELGASATQAVRARRVTA